MKLLIAERQAYRHYVSREFYYIMQDLITDYGWQHVELMDLWNDPKPVRENLLDKFGELPEIVIFWGADGCVNRRARDVSELDCHKCIYSDDVHFRNREGQTQRLVSYLLCDTVFAPYAYLFDRYFPGVSNLRNVVWSPHSASPDFMLPYNEHPHNAIFLRDAITRDYPLRQRMKALYDQGNYAIKYHPHPGYHCGYAHDRDNTVGPGYAAMINDCRVAFTDALTFGYVVAKYFEFPAAGALLLADDSVAAQLEALGFVEDVHYCAVSDNNLESRVRFVLDERNFDRIDRIRRQGQQFVQNKHLTSHRARRIDEVCTNLIGK